MPKERAPIAARLRRRENNHNSSKQNSSEEIKREESASVASVQSVDDNLSFSPRTDPDIYLDELHSNLSFARGAEEEKHQYLKEEQERIQKNFGKNHDVRVKLSTFYSAMVGAPVPSKRTRHRDMKGLLDTKKINPDKKIQKQKDTSHNGNERRLSFDATNERRLSVDNTETNNKEEEENVVRLPLSKTLPVYIKMTAKDRDQEVERRLRRAFVHSRYLTNEECLKVAKSVYSNLSANTVSRMITSMQGNISSFRLKLRRIFDSHLSSFGITKDFTMRDYYFQENYIYQKLTLEVLKTIWKHWIVDPYVDTRQFYNDGGSIQHLRMITTRLMVVHFMEHFSLLSYIESYQKVKEIDMLSRELVLPDTSKLA